MNEDQIETISRKSEVNGNIKELEGILEQVLLFEKMVIPLTSYASLNHDRQAIADDIEKKTVLEQEKTRLVADAVEQERVSFMLLI